MKNVAFYDILYLWLYYRPVDRELSRNFLVDPSRRQVGHICCTEWKLRFTLLISAKSSVIVSMVVMGSSGDTFLKVKAQVQVKKPMENFCNLNRQLWRHKHWNMTSLTFVSIFKQFYARFYKPSTTLSILHPVYLHYTLSIYATLTWANKCD